jgi:hypothetical protein
MLLLLLLLLHAHTTQLPRFFTEFPPVRSQEWPGIAEVFRNLTAEAELREQLTLQHTPKQTLQQQVQQQQQQRQHSSSSSSAVFSSDSSGATDSDSATAVHTDTESSTDTEASSNESDAYSGSDSDSEFDTEIDFFTETETDTDTDADTDADSNDSDSETEQEMLLRSRVANDWQVSYSCGIQQRVYHTVHIHITYSGLTISSTHCSQDSKLSTASSAIHYSALRHLYVDL